MVWVFTLILGGNDAAEAWPAAPSIWLRFGLLAGLLVAVGEFHRAEVRDLEAMRAADADRAALEQQTLQARLRVLEAQIEPHFLFNTLANLRRLYADRRRGAARTMLRRLDRAISRAALPAMRSDQLHARPRSRSCSSAYLGVQQVRMGRRLEFAIDIAPALRDARACRR